MRRFGRQSESGPSNPLTTDQVLQQEAEAIHQAHIAGKSGSDLYRALNELNSAALCLSGGGIRSAAFGLGIIQALAAHPRRSDGTAVESANKSLLAQFHYLSTVSGGGYVGSWLSAWCRRIGFATVWSDLVGRPAGPDTEPPSIGWLRSYSNYLTPHLGMVSADAWAIVAMYLRNLVLNWLVILPALCFGILTLKFVVLLLLGFGRVHYLLDAMGILGVLCLVVSLRFVARQRPSRGVERALAAGAASEPPDAAFLRGDLAWSLVSAILLTEYLDMWIFKERNSFTSAEMLRGITACAIGGMLIYLAGWVFGRLGGGEIFDRGAVKREIRRSMGWKEIFSDCFIWMCSGLASGLLVGAGFFWVFYYRLHLYPLQSDPGSQVPIVSGAVAPLIVGVPWILVAQFVASMVFNAATSHRSQFNADQEWLGRASGWLLLAAVVWAAGMFVTFAGSPFVVKETTPIYRFLEWSVLVTALAALVIALLGSSGLFRNGFGLNGSLSIVADLITVAAAALFVGALIYALSSALDYALLGLVPAGSRFAGIFGGLEGRSRDYRFWELALSVLFIAMAGFAGIAHVASLFININRFSLHEMYRNRLTRAFLGASSRKRTPDPFTGFDDGDDVPMHELWPDDAGGWRPFQVVNLTLNIVSSERLAWQERKAAPFTVSPLHCGTSSRTYGLDSGAGNRSDRVEGAYRSSSEYGGPGGISLGTAMAISGAAANPNMGYHSSPAVTFLMTMFNLRLGWWLGNPGPEGAKSYSHDGPAIAIRPLLDETFGLTTDTRDYINLSDGGHFDNLGLYEMVRRRCRFILIADASCDPTYAFSDLGNAVRKVSIDLGVRIRFGNLEKLKPRPLDGTDLGPGYSYYAIAEIDYRAADGGCAGGDSDIKNGAILYVKVGYHGTESADVRSYAIANLTFPHQSTMNQWYKESQFESYRSLGLQIMDTLLHKALAEGPFANAPILENLIPSLRDSATSASNNVVEFQQSR
jgi:hypothetical protein